MDHLLVKNTEYLSLSQAIRLWNDCKSTFSKVNLKTHRWESEILRCMITLHSSKFPKSISCCNILRIPWVSGLNADSDSKGPCQGLRFCILNKILGDISYVGPWNSLLTPPLSNIPVYLWLTNQACLSQHRKNRQTNKQISKQTWRWR